MVTQHRMAMGNLNKSKETKTTVTTVSIHKNQNPPLRTQFTSKSTFQCEVWEVFEKFMK
jgi:hypothetical protein